MVGSIQPASKKALKNRQKLTIVFVNTVRPLPGEIGAPNLHPDLMKSWDVAIPYFLWSKCFASPLVATFGIIASRSSW